MPDGVGVSPRETAYTPAPGTVRWCRGLPYTRTMEWDPDKLQADTLRLNDIKADTLLPSDPKWTVGTVKFDKIFVGELEWDDDLLAALREQAFI